MVNADVDSTSLCVCGRKRKSKRGERERESSQKEPFMTQSPAQCGLLLASEIDDRMMHTALEPHHHQQEEQK